jgi:hypothetical protein
MPEELRWNLSVQVTGGPTVATRGIMQADVYSKMQVVVPAQSGGTSGSLEVTLDTANLTLLLITANQYFNPDDPTQVLQYNAGSSAVNLTEPLILLGDTGVDLLGAGSSVNNITFTNPMDQAITIDIVTAGDATP